MLQIDNLRKKVEFWDVKSKLQDLNLTAIRNSQFLNELNFET